MKIIKFLAYAVGCFALLVGLFLFGARFADGPIEIIAGGPFKTGEPYNGPEPDWSFVRDTETVQFQLLDPARSRTTWIVEHEGRIYIPCGYMTTTWGKIWKKWPFEAERDGRAILRVNGVLYPRQLQRITDGPMIEPVLQRLGEKYNLGEVTREALDSGYMWLFEMTPPAA